MSATRPVPTPDEQSAPFFDGALAGKLMLLRCDACGTFQSPTAYLGVPVRPRCVECFAATLSWAPASGRGTLHSYVVVHHAGEEAFAGEVPYSLAVVETSEGVRLTSRVLCSPPAELRIGMAVEAVFDRRSDTVAIPMFRVLR